MKLFKMFLNWYKGYLSGENSVSNPYPIYVVGRFILSIWILIIGICAMGILMSRIFAPQLWVHDDHSNECYEYTAPDGSSANTCDFLTP